MSVRLSAHHQEWEKRVCSEGDALVSKNRMEAAFKVYESAMKVSPHTVEFMARISEIVQYIVPNSLGKEKEFLELYNRIGNYFVVHEKYNQAILVYTDALKFTTDKKLCIEILGKRSKIYELAGRLENAAEDRFKIIGLKHDVFFKVLDEVCTSDARFSDIVSNECNRDVRFYWIFTRAKETNYFLNRSLSLYDRISGKMTSGLAKRLSRPIKEAHRIVISTYLQGLAAASLKMYEVARVHFSKVSHCTLLKGKAKEALGETHLKNPRF